MARIRTIKPEWLADEKLKGASDRARLLSVALILLADDYGNGDASELALAGQVWGAEADAIRAIEVLREALSELATLGYVHLYRVHGQRYYHLRGWERHQRVDKPGRPQVPGPERSDESEVAETILANDSRAVRASGANGSRTARESFAPDRDREEEGDRERGGTPPTPYVSVGGGDSRDATEGRESPPRRELQTLPGVDVGPPGGSAARRGKHRSKAQATAEERAVAARVIGELARVSGVEYEPDADGNVSKVVSLLRSGRTEADLVAVVRDRARRWRGDEKMAEYLRPATVFGKQKFPDYLAQARTTGGGAGEAELAAVREREAGFDTPDFGDWGAR